MFCARSFLIQLFSVPLIAHLEGRCLERMDAQLRGHTETIGQRMEGDLDALLPLTAVPYDVCDRQPGRVSSLSLVRYKTNDYSVPVAMDTGTFWEGDCARVLPTSSVLCKIGFPGRVNFAQILEPCGLARGIRRTGAAVPCAGLFTMLARRCADV